MAFLNSIVQVRIMLLLAAGVSGMILMVSIGSDHLLASAVLRAFNVSTDKMKRAIKFVISYIFRLHISDFYELTESGKIDFYGHIFPLRFSTYYY